MNNVKLVGETRFTTGTMYTDKLFTGQREITGAGIYHYGARFYSPKLGRFLSADTIVPGFANPQNLNRYSYVTNNPLRYIDPTGHRACGDEEGISCETGFLNNPSDHTNKGCGGPGQKPCIGNSPNKDKDKEKEEQVQFCIEHSNYPECGVPAQSSISQLQPSFELIAPWELNRLNAWGFLANGTGCFIVVCADISLNLIGNSTLGESTLFVTPGIHFGLGWGVDGSVGLMGAYDAPNNSSLAGSSNNLSVNITPGTGLQGTWSGSADPNFTGNYAQTYSLAISAGGEASAVYGPSYSVPLVTCTTTDCYWGVK